MGGDDVTTERAALYGHIVQKQMRVQEANFCQTQLAGGKPSLYLSLRVS
jgi:hypothetical protein